MENQQVFRYSGYTRELPDELGMVTKRKGRNQKHSSTIIANYCEAIPNDYYMGVVFALSGLGIANKA